MLKFLCSLQFIQQLQHLSEQGQLRLLLTRRDHPLGFDQSRSVYIDSRVRLLAILFAVLTPLWIPVDYFILTWDQFQLMAVIRLLFSFILVLLAGVSDRGVTYAQARRRLITLMVLPALFHLSTQSLLEGMWQSNLIVFYTFLPFLIIVMHCVFPLTLIEGVGLAVLSITLLSLDELFFGSVLSFQGLAHLWLMCLIMGVAIWAQLSQLHMQLKLFNEATTDPLTGLLNRRTLMKQLDYIKQQNRRDPRFASLLMMDLDLFKKINDNYGHQTGDRVLQRFAEIVTEQARSTDYVARFGGEEFLALLPETRPEEALLLAERICQACRAEKVCIDEQKNLHFSVSIGVGQLNSEASVEEALSQTDVALYQAKQQGRDQVVVA